MKKVFFLVVVCMGIVVVLTSCGRRMGIPVKPLSGDGSAPVVSATAAPNAADTFIGEEKAKEIALEKAGLSAADVKFVRVEIDREFGTAVYEVEFRDGFKEYSAEIKADDGTILEWDVDFGD